MHVPSLIAASRLLCRQAEALTFAPPVRYVYNPLRYAREPWEHYLDRFAGDGKAALFLGMNPGPWGMAQTGVPFGEISVVSEWLKISGRIAAPRDTHPRLPVRGLATQRSEVSGRRLWGLMREHYGTAEELSRDVFVANYCPLLFLDEAGRNLTPDKIARQDRAGLHAVCNRFLLLLLETMQPRWVVGVGVFALLRLQEATAAMTAEARFTVPRAVMIPHPSPANPRANRDWAGLARAILVREGIWVG
jgi:single-strand selective monofunctional uracil DNA glycosylase